jgi:ABC-2 type transport system permease protein
MSLFGLSFARAGAVMRKEFLQLRRDRTTFGMIIVIPLMQLLLFGYAINTDPKHLPTALLMRADGPLARGFVAGIENADYFDVKSRIFSEAEGKRLLREGRMQFVITIPESFDRDFVRGQPPKILIEADATDPTASAGALAAMEGLAQSFARRELKGPLAFLKNAAPPFAAQVHKLYNPEGFSRYNIVPGLMGIVLTMMGIMMTALALTRERERGTMENLLSMPVRPIEVMAGKIAPYVIIGYVQAGLILLAAHFLFEVPILGDVGILGVLLGIFIICNLALGFTVSAAAQNQTQALQLSFVPFLPSILLSGFMFPFAGMPLWAQTIGRAVPTTYFIRIVRGIVLKGNGWVELWPDIWPLAVFMAVISAVALKVYRKTLD